MSIVKRLVVFSLVLLGSFLVVATGYGESKLKGAPARTRVGWVERMRVYPENLLFEVKLTPGSEGNVIHGEKVNVFRRGGERWLRFQLSDREGKSAVVERKVTNRISVRNTHGGLEHHYEVRLGFCLDTHYAELNFAVRDRSGFEHEARLGRDALAGIFLIDPAATHVTEPNCSERVLRKAMADIDLVESETSLLAPSPSVSLDKVEVRETPAASLSPKPKTVERSKSNVKKPVQKASKQTKAVKEVRVAEVEVVEKNGSKVVEIDEFDEEYSEEDQSLEQQVGNESNE